MNERMVKRTALRRVGEPQDIANAITFLCSDLAAYITGVGLNVSGGIELLHVLMELRHFLLTCFNIDRTR